MPSKNDRLSSFSSSSFSSSSSSSQLSTPRAFQNGSSRAIAKSPLLDVEKAKCSFGFSMPKSNEELRAEISELETEILQLEQYLLSLYRTSFGNQLHAFLLQDDSSLPPSKPHATKSHNNRVSYESDTSLLSSFKPLCETDKMKRSESGHPSLADLLGITI